MSVSISCTYRFEAAHWLPYVPDGHKCKRMHGHNYRVEVSVCDDLNEFQRDYVAPNTGWVMDFADLDKVVLPIINRLDHQCLNNLPGLINPTAEKIAIRIRQEVEGNLPEGFSCVAVIVWETDDKRAIAT